MEDKPLFHQVMYIDKNGENIGFLSSQIDINLHSFNLSIHINNKELCENNKEEVKEKCNEFITQSLNEAVKVGWDVLKQ